MAHSFRMEYCPPNVTFDKIWVDHGISQCFMETVSAAFIGGFLILFGLLQIRMYKRYATEVVDVSYSRLFGVQLFFTLFVPVLAVIRFLLQVFIFKDGHIYGYMIVALVTTLILFPLSAYLAILEVRFLLPSVPPRGHGIVLLVFWAMIFVSENLSFLNLNKEGWWWHLKDQQDRLEMSLFVGRYVSCMIMFILGMKAPGINHSFESLDNEDGPRRNIPPRIWVAAQLVLFHYSNQGTYYSSNEEKNPICQTNKCDLHSATSPSYRGPIELILNKKSTALLARILPLFTYIFTFLLYL